MILPIGGFTICWSDKVVDLYAHQSRTYGGGQANSDRIRAFLDTLEYQVENLTGAVGSNCKFMLHGAEYFGVRVSSQDQAVGELRRLVSMAAVAETPPEALNQDDG